MTAGMPEHADQHPQQHPQDVRRYYDQNTGLFERFGQGGASIHRAVWGPGVETRAQAFHHVDELILAELRALGGAPRVADLGCGVGGSLLYLAARMNLRGEGMTISPRQADRAARLIAEAQAGGGLTGSVRCRQGDYLALPPDLVDLDLAFSIEAFVHSPDGARFFHSAARALRPGGTLMICDDFLASGEPPAPARRRRWLEEFRAGWRIGTLITVAEARALAAAEGLALVGDRDLSPHLELGRFRDRLISLLVLGARPFRPQGETLRGLIGGNALQLALKAGIIQYRLLTFRRRP